MTARISAASGPRTGLRKNRSAIVAARVPEVSGTAAAFSPASSSESVMVSKRLSDRRARGGPFWWGWPAPDPTGSPLGGAAPAVLQAPRGVLGVEAAERLVGDQLDTGVDVARGRHRRLGLVLGEGH